MPILNRNEIIAGIIHPFGPGAGKPKNQSNWIFTFSLIKWKDSGGQIIHKELLMFPRMVVSIFIMTMVVFSGGIVF